MFCENCKPNTLKKEMKIVDTAIPRNWSQVPFGYQHTPLYKKMETGRLYCPRCGVIYMDLKKYNNEMAEFDKPPKEGEKR